jgi:4-aminobutyrate aminotransferase-like enzyme
VCMSVQAAGSYVWDKDGTKYLDFSCGIAVTNTGHCHPKVVKAAQAQLGARRRSLGRRR